MADDKGLEKIREAVFAQADQEAKHILERAEQEAARIGRDYDRQIEALEEETRKEGEAHAASQSKRTGSMARLDQRRIMLVARQELLEKVVRTALERLRATDEDARRKIYRDLLPNEAEEGTVAVAARGERDLLASVIEDSPVAGKIEVAKEEGPFDGGFLIRRGQVTDNLSFEAIFANRANELRREAARVLFETDAAGRGTEGDA